MTNTSGRATLQIKHKFAITFYVGLLFVSAVLGVYQYRSQRALLVEKAGAAGMAIAAQVGGSFDFLFGQLNSTADYVFLDADVRRLMDKYGSAASVGEPPSGPHEITLANLVVTQSTIGTLSIYNSHGLPLYVMATDNTSAPRTCASEAEQAILRRAIELNGRPVWFGIAPGEKLFFDQNRQPKVALCRVIKNRNLSAVAGFVVLTVNQGNLKKNCVNFPVPAPAYIRVETPGGFVAYEDGKGGEQADAFVKAWHGRPAGYEQVQLNGGDGLAIHHLSAEGGVEVFYLLSTVGLRQEVQSLGGYIALAVALCMLGTIPIFAAVTTRMVCPINELTRSMKAFEGGDFTTRVSPRGHDELGVLAEGFNHMVESFGRLVEHNYLLEIREREAELTALQAQVNPHFLYNTLEMIYWEAVEHGQDGLGQMVLSLSRLFRLSLGRGAAGATVDSEVECIGHYLLLQKIRFGARLEYSVDCEAGIRTCPVPSLILQPIVENAFVHGFADKTDTCRLRVQVRRADAAVEYEVEDNGAGMPAEQVARILAKAATPSAVKLEGHAISNIIDRLSLHYRDGFGFWVQSRAGAGSVFRVHIPFTQKAEEEPI